MSMPIHRTQTARIYAVLFGEASQEAAERLAQLYPVNYKLTDTLFLVRTRSLADDVAVATRIKGKEREVTGVVFKLNKAYAGYYKSTLWDWLGDDE